MERRSILARCQVLQDLAILQELLYQWNNKINLTSQDNLFLDRISLSESYEISRALNGEDLITDIGSGNGVTIWFALSFHLSLGSSSCSWTAVDSDHRKCAFLREASRLAKLPLSISSKRIESDVSLFASVLVAKAFADLKTLATLAQGHSSQTKMVLAKGPNIHSEIDGLAIHFSGVYEFEAVRISKKAFVARFTIW